MKRNFLATSLKLSSVIALLATTGCAEYHRRVLTRMDSRGTEFNKTLAKEYEALGTVEQNAMYDEASANYYYCKGISSKKGYNVLPTPLNKWDIEKDKLPELEEARARLMHALQAGARTLAPNMTAFTQAHFDCWVEQQAEGWQKTDIARCRSEFYKGMAEVEVLLRGGEAAIMPNDMVFFSFNSAHLDCEAMKVIDAVAGKDKSQRGAYHILLVGRTDEAGDEKYNENLSLNRAMAVKKELIRRGVAPQYISIKGAGETPGPKVDAHNRRVDILFLTVK